MWFILQIALGVCGGLLLFLWLVTREPRARRPLTVSRAIGLCAAACAILWLIDVILIALR